MCILVNKVLPIDFILLPYVAEMDSVVYLMCYEGASVVQLTVRRTAQLKVQVRIPVLLMSVKRDRLFGLMGRA